jgi:G2/mitotic-specific cyclin 1/2
MLNYILKPIRHESFHKKYAGKKYYKVCSLLLSPSPFGGLIAIVSPVEYIYERMGSAAMV